MQTHCFASRSRSRERRMKYRESGGYWNDGYRGTEIRNSNERERQREWHRRRQHEIEMERRRQQEWQRKNAWRSSEERRQEDGKNRYYEQHLFNSWFG